MISFNHQTEQLAYVNADKSYYTKLEQDLEEALVKVNSTTTFTRKNNFFAVNQDSIKPFNPNDLPKQGWEKLGFTPKQAEVIMKYKQILGGKFESKEQLKKCYVISDEAYAMLESKILLPEKAKSDYKLEKSQLSKKVNYQRFNPNNFTAEDWMNIGFSSKQAATILKYKNILGGEFKSKEQIRKCYVISEEKFNEMNSYIDLPEKVESTYTKKETVEKEPKESQNQYKSEAKAVVITEKFNPNNLDHEGWMKLGFTEKQAQTILNFKRSLGGKFKDAKTLSRSYVISEEKFKEMEPFLVFD